MPLNAPPEFNKAMERYSQARTLKEKIKALEEALRYLPKHKGAENMRAVLQRRLAQLRREQERKKKSGGGRSVLVEKQGFMAVLFGLPNSGKTLVLSQLTSAPVKPTPQPMATVAPVPGIMEWEGGRVQLVEVPSYFPGYEESRIGKVGLTTIRSADALILVIDLRRDPLDQLNTLKEFLEKEGIYLNRERPPVVVRRLPHPEFIFYGEGNLRGEREEFLETLRSLGYRGAEVIVRGPITPEDLLVAIDESAVFLPAILLGTFSGHEEEFQSIDGFRKVIFRGKESAGEIFRSLGLIRVFTRSRRGEVSKSAVTMPAGSRVEDLAEKIFPGRKVSGARVWGSTKFPGQRVPLDYVLSDGDVVELLL